MDLVQARAEYAENLRRLGEIRTSALVRAFATVPREEFVGLGPWKILFPNALRAGYRTTDDAPPRHLYQNVHIALDENRRLNNGEPLALARWLDALELKAGDRVLHIGCGVGYYTAIIAEAVTPNGAVVGVEFDAPLAATARDKLARYANVKVVCEDGSSFDAGPMDVIFVNAGTTHPQSIWLDRLRPQGRLLVPLTVEIAGHSAGAGHMLKVTHAECGFTARFVSPVCIFHCAGARTDEANERLRRAYEAGDLDTVRELRREPHSQAKSCWLHTSGFCLSTGA